LKIRLLPPIIDKGGIWKCGNVYEDRCSFAECRSELYWLRAIFGATEIGVRQSLTACHITQSVLDSPLTLTVVHSLLFRIKMYLSPAYFMAVMCLVTLYCLVIHFADRRCVEPVESTKKNSTRRTAIGEVADSRTSGWGLRITWWIQGGTESLPS
jgi:hypothetical protein